MASRTQLRLPQITGSFRDIKNEAVHYVTPVAVTALTGSDLSDTLGAMAAALNRIHGAASSEPFNATAGHFLNAATTDGSDDGGAIKLSAASGGIGIAFADDKSLWAEGGKIMMVANENDNNAIKLHAEAGANQIITIVNDEGSTDGADQAGAILIDATAGGIGLHAANTKTIYGEGGKVQFVAEENNANAIKLHADAGVNQKITLLNDEGNTESAITLTSTAGGIDLNAHATKDITLDAGQILLTSAHATAGSVTIAADAGAAETVILRATQGNTAGSVQVTSVDGGITLSAGGHNLVLTGAITKDIEINLGGKSTNEAVKIKDADDSTLFSLDGSGKAIFEGDVDVVGSFSVVGTTTTISSSNTVIQDSIIGLGISGSSNDADDYNDLGDRGFIFARAANAHAALPGFWWDGTNFNLATSLTSPLSQSFGAVGTYSDLKLGNLYPGADDTFDLGSTSLAWQDLHLEGDILFTDAGKVETTAGDLTVASAAGQVIIDAETDIVLDAKGDDVIFKDDGTIFGTLSNDSGDLIMSSAAGGGLTLTANSNLIDMLSKDGLNLFEVDLNTANTVKLTIGAETKLTLVTGAAHILSGTLKLQNGAAASDLIFQEAAANGTGNLTLRGPAVNSNDSVVLTLPATVGTANQALVTDGNSPAVLSFADVGSAAIRKSLFNVTSSLTAGQQVILTGTYTSENNAVLTKLNGSDNVSFSSTDTFASRGRFSDVFVNGQLLLSGADVSNDTCDYNVMSQTTVKFAFDLEVGDIIQVVTS